jgi:hypothetical protein
VTTPTDITKGYADVLLSFQIFLISRAKFQFHNFFASVLEGYGSRELLYHKCCFILSWSDFFPCPHFLIPVIIIIVVVVFLACELIGGGVLISPNLDKRSK